MGKLTINDFDEYTEQGLITGKGRSLKVRCNIKTARVKFILKTLCGEFIFLDIKNAIDAFNNEDY